MHTLRTGSMLAMLPSPTRTILITGNATVKQNGALVMGRGAALELKTIRPGIDFELGRAIKAAGPDYGLIVLPNGYGVLQVKHHFTDNASLDLIRGGLLKADLLAKPGNEVHCNFPGIGAGRLPRTTVEPVIDALDLNPNVHLWTFR